LLQDLSDWAADVVESLGYLGVALLVAIENVFPPIPSEVVLSLAGFVASRGDASPVGMVIAATIGSVVGAWALYGISAAVGPIRLRALVIRYGGWIGFGESDLDRAEAWFDRRSVHAVLVCRCIPLLRSLISIPAGFRRMPLVSFTIYTAIGSLVWNTALITAGYLLGDQWEDVLAVIEPFQNLVLIAIGLVIVGIVVRKIWMVRTADDRTDKSFEELVDEIESHADDDQGP
jgi:membrane protein DedA with SNARE-associated domain